MKRNVISLRRFVAIGLVCSALLFATSEKAKAQQASDSKSQSTATQPTVDFSKLTQSLIDEKIKQAQLITDEVLRGEVLTIYAKASASLKQAETWTARLEELKKQRLGASAQIEKVKASILKPIEKVDVEVDPDRTLSQLEQQLEKLQAQLDVAEKQKSQLDIAIKEQMGRRTQIPELSAKASQCAINARRDLNSAAAGDVDATSSDDIVIANKIFLQAQAKACVAESQAYDEELLGLDSRIDLLRAQFDLADRDLLLKQKEVAVWQKVVNTRRREQADLAADTARKEAAQALPSVRKIAEENARLAQLASGKDGLAARIEKFGQRNDHIKVKLTELRDRSRNIKAMIERAGVTKAIGLLLRKDRSNLVSVQGYRQERKEIQNKIADANFQLIQLQEQRLALTDIDQLTNEILRSLPESTSESQLQEITVAAHDGLMAKKTYLTTLVDYYDDYIETLVALDTNEKDLIRETKLFANYIDEHVLWFASTGPIGMKSITNSLGAGRWLANPFGWREVVKSFGLDTAYHLVMNSVVLILFVCLLVMRRRFIGLIRKMSLSETSRKLGSYWGSLEVLALTVVIAVVWPLLLWFIGGRLEIGGTTEFTRSVASGFKGMAMVLATLNIVVCMCLKGGLAEKHFHWNAGLVQVVRKNAKWLVYLSLPMIFVTAAMETQSNEVWRDSLGRIAYMVMFAGLGITFWRIARGSKVEVKDPNRRRDWLGVIKYFWYPFFVLPFILMLIAGLGYYYTAMQLGWKILYSLWLVLGLMILREMLLDWLGLAQRKLAAAKIAKQKIDFKVKTQADGAGSEKFPSPSTEMDMVEISSQNRKLLRTVMAVAVPIGIWFIWSDFMPALGVLRRINLWQEVTLASVLMAILVMIMTFIVDKNISGFLEVTILHKLPLDAGSRNAIATLMRYFITVVGMVIAFDLIGIGWSKIQWLIAAVTVGLGFGLQEIFANFVSGLIILFERPIRVGDVVTVGDVSGTVNRIQIRATTIIDWDRKELIVPNREFITGRVINWTLSDRILRMVICVGVAYGSDTDKVQRLLLEAARSVSEVLDEPEPSAIFSGFGDSSLNFELRAFIPNVDKVLSVRHALYTAVDKKFKEAKIEIPFPQQDLHVRDFRDALAIQQSQQPDLK